MSLDLPPLAEHLLQAWPDEEQRRIVIDGYGALALNKLLLADIALQGGVFLENDGATDAYGAGVTAGRRQLAVRIVKAANAEPMLLMDYFAKRRRLPKPQEEKS